MPTLTRLIRTLMHSGAFWPAIAATNTPWADLIECKKTVDDYQTIAEQALSGDSPMPGISKIANDNAFMAEYQLAQPIQVQGFSTRRIAFAGNAVLAILDTADAASLARKHGMDIALNTPNKFMASKTVTSGADADGLRQEISLNASTVTTHPGKTLFGCSYKTIYPEDAIEL